MIKNRLKTPSGQIATNVNGITLLEGWANALKTAGKNIISAGTCTPTFPAHLNFFNVLITLLAEKKHTTIAARSLFEIPNKSGTQRRDAIETYDAVFGYEDPQGVQSARKNAAQALTKWYGVNITAGNLLFTTGIAGSWFDIYTMINHKQVNGLILTPFPYSHLYASNSYQANQLHSINVMREDGYKLSARTLTESIVAAKKKSEQDGYPITAFLFCDPNNPLGTVISKEEWIKIAEVLKTVPDVPIILDATYAGIVFDPNNTVSLLEIADEELKKRIILLRSVEALFAPSFHIGVAIAFDPKIIARLEQTNIDTSGHPVTIIQEAFAEMLDILNDETEIKHFVEHYKPQVDIVFDRFHKMGAGMPNKNYKPEGTFYVMADLSDLLGLEIHPDAYKVVGQKKFIENDEDLCYDLLFRDGVMIAPMSYYGLDGEKHAYMRITCSGGDKTLNQLMDILALRLLNARIYKINELIHDTQVLLDELKGTDVPTTIIECFEENLRKIQETKFKEPHNDDNAQKAKLILHQIKNIKDSLKENLITYHEGIKQRQQLNEKKVLKHIRKLCLARAAKQIVKSEWKKFVDEQTSKPATRNAMYKWSASDRDDYKGWIPHLHAAPLPRQNLIPKIPRIS